jgi:hypothetical protein
MPDSGGSIKNEHHVIEKPMTPKEQAQAQVAALRKDMNEGWGWQRTGQLEASVTKAHRIGAMFGVDLESYDKARALAAKYSVEPEIEWDGQGPHQFIIQFCPDVRIAGRLTGSDVDENRSIDSGQLVGSLALDCARMEYQNESTPWLQLPISDVDQQAVTAFVERLLML